MTDRSPGGRLTDEVSGGRPTFTRPRAATPTAASRPRAPFLLLLGVLVIGGMALLLVLNTASAANELGRQRYADADTEVSAQVEQLRNEVAASAAPGNLASAAAALGMVPGGNPAFVIVGAGGKVVTRGSAAPASEVQVVVPKATSPKASPTATAKPSSTATAKPSSTATAKASPTATPKSSPTATGTARPTSKAKPSTSSSGRSRRSNSVHPHGGTR